MRVSDYDERTTHVGFADEAYWNQKEFRAVACVSARRKDYHEVERRLCASRCDAGALVSEVKWADTRTRDRQRDAASVLETAVDLAASRKLHIDVLVWNGQGRNYLDRFSTAPGNRETMHLQMMYRFLFSGVIAHWHQTENTVAPHWTFAPDRQEGVDFPAVQQDLYLDPAFPGGAVVNVINDEPALNYSLQLADLLAGLAAYSHQCSDEYGVWLRQRNLPGQQLYAAQWRTRFPILDRFLQHCQANELGPTMLSAIPAFSGFGLWTPEPDTVRHRISIQPFTPLP